MRLFHTSDWHLGQKFIGQSREVEQQMALDWLLSAIQAEKPDLLIVAGDVFDAHSPPQTAEEQYYRFLAALRDTSCQHVVIVGGNHDAALKLNAPQGLLRALHIHVMGGAAPSVEEEVLVLRDAEQRPLAVVAAIPFLRDRDLGFVPGETAQARTERLRAGILERYQRAADYLATLQESAQAPCIATGHLFAKGAEAAEEQQNIYIGDLENIAADQFPAVFQYVALGHIHRAQPVGGQRHIRYSGSLIPLSFSENHDRKAVICVDFNAVGQAESIRSIPVPTFRELRTLHGTTESLLLQLSVWPPSPHGLATWAEVLLADEGLPADALARLREAANAQNVQLLKIRRTHAYVALSEQMAAEDLRALSPEVVFLQRCAAKGYSPEAQTALLATFRELYQTMPDAPV